MAYCHAFMIEQNKIATMIELGKGGYFFFSRKALYLVRVMIGYF